MSLQPIADQSALINAAIGGEFQAVGWRNHPGGDPDTQYVWWYNIATEPRRNPVNFGRFNDPEINRLLDEGRTTADDGRAPADLRGPEQAVRRAAVEHLGQRTRSGRSPVQPNVHGVLGPDLPDGSGPFPGLATGHPVSGMWVSQ